MFEDDPGWDCATMGNMICGLPDTSMPAPDGTVDIGGILMVAALLVAYVWGRIYGEEE